MTATPTIKEAAPIATGVWDRADSLRIASRAYAVSLAELADRAPEDRTWDEQRDLAEQVVVLWTEGDMITRQRYGAMSLRLEAAWNRVDRAIADLGLDGDYTTDTVTCEIARGLIVAADALAVAEQAVLLALAVETLGQIDSEVLTPLLDRHRPLVILKGYIGEAHVPTLTRIRDAASARWDRECRGLDNYYASLLRQISLRTDR